MLKKSLFKMHDNVVEARKLMETASALKEKHRRAADWYRDMAIMHLQFNQMGREIARDMMAEYGPHMSADAKAVYEDMLGEIMQDCTEAKMMVEMYKG